MAAHGAAHAVLDDPSKSRLDWRAVSCRILDNHGREEEAGPRAAGVVWPSDRKQGFLLSQLDQEPGLSHDLFDGRPVIGICNTWSELTPCNGHFRELAEFVKRGVYEAGGFPLEFPVMSLGETLMRPTAMLFRNLASMDVEESIRGNPIDGVVLLMGCDKTTPSLLMGAASCRPAHHRSVRRADALRQLRAAATWAPAPA